MFMRASFRSAARNVVQCFKRNLSGPSRDDYYLDPAPQTNVLFRDLVKLPGSAKLRLVRLMANKPSAKIAELVGLNQAPGNIKRTWEGVLTAPDVGAMLHVLKDSYSDIAVDALDAASSPMQPSLLPTLLLLHILFNCAKTLEHLIRTLAFVQDQLPTTPLPFRPILIILAVSKAAELRLVAPLRPFIESFLELDSVTAVHYRLLLRGLSLAPRSAETSNLAMKVVTSPGAKRYKLWNKDIYDALLRPSFLTLAIAEHVPKRNTGRVKPMLHSQALLRLYSHHGFRRRAFRYLRLLNSTHGTSPPMARGSRLSRAAAPSRWDYMYLAAFRHTATAYRYIRQMSAARSSSTPNRVRKSRGLSTRSGPCRSSRLKTRQVLRESTGMASMPRAPAPSHMTSSTNISEQSGLSSSDPLYIRWLSILQVAAKDPKLTAHALFLKFRRGGVRYMTLSAYEIVIRGLLRKQGFDPAVALWRELRDGGWSIGKTTLVIGVRALASANQGHEAFELLEEVNARYQARSSQDNTGARPQIEPKAVNIEAINQFMTALRRKGRPDAVFAFWDAMGVLYHLSPDVYTLNIMLGTARWARKYDQSLRGAFRSALAEFGLSRSRRAILDMVEGTAPEKIRKQVVSYIESTLDPDYPPRVTGQWGPEPASTAAVRIAVQVFLGNWPQLRAVRPPVRTTRRRPNDPATAPLLDLFHTLSESPYDDDHPTPLLHLLPEDAPPYPYPYIYPTDLTFRAFFDLLACELLHTEIPVALAWMRALEIRPSKTTLATALIHYTEVGMDAPLIERFKGGPLRSPYTMLMAWMRGWVGEENMPTRMEMSDEMARLAFYRHARYDNKHGFVVVNASGRHMKRELRWAHARVE
ncbi:hypothetical protein BDY19DRAFT_1084865 [Irpex rosettiformis]|uniref:Uncharacterized protein n=1 Tax=Irpex rosettiformis TaxID=378272 RepID=A0ACB8UF51_9APHY|nr:hypothetical protein BDY19DRAFT_1084865 [Irpex rosettiformis]